MIGKALGKNKRFCCDRCGEKNGFGGGCGGHNSDSV